jgi:hypothetical protein
MDSKFGSRCLPAQPEVAQGFVISVKDALISCSDRLGVERRLAGHVSNSIGGEGSGPVGVQIVSRTLKIGRFF